MTDVRVECPRCGQGMAPPRVALSRWDSKTEICPECGTEEAMAQLEVASAGGSRDALLAVVNPRGWWNVA